MVPSAGKPIAGRLPRLRALLGLFALSSMVQAQPQMTVLMEDGTSWEQDLGSIRTLVYQEPDLVIHLEGEQPRRIPHAGIRRITFDHASPVRSAPGERGFDGIRLAADGPGRVSALLRVHSRGPVRVEILAPDGTRVRSLADGIFGPGLHAFDWDGSDRAGRGAESGVYLLAAALPGRTLSKAFLLFR